MGTQNWWHPRAELVALNGAGYVELVALPRRIGGALYIEQNIPEHSLQNILQNFQNTRAGKLFLFFCL